MEKICLDFDTALDFLRGDPPTIEKLKYYADREELCITSLSMMHLLETVKKREAIMALANSVTVLPLDKKAAHIAHQINRDMQGKGEIPKTKETVFTAAICMANDAFLFSRSSWKFDGINGLKRV
ncbi:type II toxin-antitoxin system VapC family toxin [Candidatus Micrarchaeota archaeon]|nr:type II toxin-antitoxin system VapC family toxin [Candidatus Micrarchaeota archaeon]MBU1165460.1 type II toxin-antitoxin system VapC family toxin [Candidatus Micrarchaeota archaeon]MBU1887441.1 type II toxin-antitoxin system VapC family toxin [Candidatus Micrarchaeota archaeon]